MNVIFIAAADVQALCQAEGWQFCFIGGVAVQRWGEPRFTADADLTLITGFGKEEPYIEEVLRHLKPRRPDAREFALRNRVLLVEHTNGVPLDIALGALPFEVATVKRASAFLFPAGKSLITCSAEDLVVHKCFAGRDLDWIDVERVLTRQWATIDFDLIRRELKPLAELKETPEISDCLERLIQKLAKSPVLSRLRTL